MKAYKNRYLTGSLTALLSCLLLFSCSEDELFDRGCSPAGEYSDHISFGVSPDTGVQTRGAAGMGSGKGEVAGNFVLRAADAPDTLCMQAVITDGINPSAEPQVVTRSTPIDSKDNFYNSFHVVAYWKKGDVPVTEQFYMDADVSEQVNNRWTTDNTYYWPGNGHTLQFYALTPDDAGIRMPATPASTHLSSYTVPQDVAEQRDILVATTEELSGNYNQAVPLTFEHICTAIKFETGSQMQPGSIRSVTLKGVKTTGAYDMFSGKWTLTEDVGNYTQELAKTMTGTETPGSEVTTAAQTFMMLPQTLPQGATVEVVFVDDVTGNERPLSATIDGTEWPQGKTVTYKISISPEYELEFISEPEMQDAHYIIYPIHIKAGDNIPGGSWTLTSTDPANVTLRSDLTTLTRRGFWVEEDKGEASITSAAVGDDITVYAFLTENSGEATREINLELKPTNSTDAIPQTFTISQLCPSWNGALGCERIEEYDEGFTGYPWGFLWDSSMKITYDAEEVSLGDRIILFFYLGIINNEDFVSQDISIFPYYHHVVIDFSKISPLDVAMSPSEGQQNTLDIYNFDGINDASSMMDMLKAWGIHPDKELPTNPTVFAARACALKNKFNKEISTSQGKPVERAVLKDENLVWYLPATNEAPQMQDADYPLEGDYWTSTAINDNQNAYKYTVGSSTTSEIRTSNLHVRAVRKKP